MMQQAMPPANLLQLAQRAKAFASSRRRDQRAIFMPHSQTARRPAGSGKKSANLAVGA